MLGRNESGGLPRRERGNSIAAANECSGTKAKEDQEERGSTDRASAGQLDETGERRDTEHVDNIQDVPVQENRYGCNPTLQPLSTSQIGNPSQARPSSGALAEGRIVSESKRAGTSSLEPPVTKATLSELDVPRIVFNPKLRHDVNFDPDLHFRPNLDGEKGRRKAQRAAEFWNRLRTQLQMFMKDSVSFETQLADQVWCLPMTLKAIREILGTLVPPEDRSLVEEIFNVNLLMQQFSKGVADLEKLAMWLSLTLKTHCAPMRDEWVDEMVKQLSSGNRNRDIPMLVQGLQTLLGVLEAMKLDVANHQIRCLRPILIQDTVEFEQKFFLKKISLGKVNVAAAHQWFRAAESFSDHPQVLSSSVQGDMWAFFKGFANLLLPSRVRTKKIPDTFMFDEERIIKLRSDMLDAVNLEICVRLFREVNEPRIEIPDSRVPSILGSRPPELLFSGSSSSSSQSAMSSPDFSMRIKRSNITNDTERHVRPAFSDRLVGTPESEGDPHPSSFPSYSPSQTETSLSAEETLRHSILAIIEDTPGDNRWSQNCSSTALQILRSSPSLRHISSFEKGFEECLQLHLSNTTSPSFLACESHVLFELYPLLSDHVTRYAHLTSAQLFEVATTPRILSFQPLIPHHRLQDASRQIAHIGILHWRVWAPLTYLVNPDADDTNAIGLTTDGKGRESRPSDRDAQSSSEERRRSLPRQGSISESISTQS